MTHLRPTPTYLFVSSYPSGPAISTSSANVKQKQNIFFFCSQDSCSYFDFENDFDVVVILNDDAADFVVNHLEFCRGFSCLYRRGPVVGFVNGSENVVSLLGLEALGIRMWRWSVRLKFVVVCLSWGPK